MRVLYRTTPNVTRGIRHLRGPLHSRLAVAERLAVELSLPVLTTWLFRAWDPNIQHFACEANIVTAFTCTTTAALLFCLFCN